MWERASWGTFISRWDDDYANVCINLYQEVSMFVKKLPAESR